MISHSLRLMLILHIRQKKLNGCFSWSKLFMSKICIENIFYSENLYEIVRSLPNSIKTTRAGSNDAFAGKAKMLEDVLKSNTYFL